MQRKLSEIAEIPKILSSTLATVSKTFNKLTHLNQQHQYEHQLQQQQQHCQEDQPKRKFSYDEDLCDYELTDQLIEYTDDDNDNDDDNNDNANAIADDIYNYNYNENEYDNNVDNIDNADDVDNDDNNILKIIPQWQVKFDAKNVYKQLKQHVATEIDYNAKKLTPESDYVSEVNDQSDNNDDDNNDDDNNDDDTNDDDNNDDDNNNDCIHYDNAILSTNYPLNQNPVSLKNAKYNNRQKNYDNNIHDANDANDANDDVTDFLNATFTWNLSKMPKFLLADEASPLSSSSTSSSPSPSISHKRESIRSNLNNINNTENIDCTTLMNPTKYKPLVQLDKIEHNWPWADRERIIYKQSTCHLVPKKPLGIIEKRIQLLAKNNLLQHLNKTTTN